MENQFFCSSLFVSVAISKTDGQFSKFISCTSWKTVFRRIMAGLRKSWSGGIPGYHLPQYCLFFSKLYVSLFSNKNRCCNPETPWICHWRTLMTAITLVFFLRSPRWTQNMSLRVIPFAHCFWMNNFLKINFRSTKNDLYMHISPVIFTKTNVEWNPLIKFFSTKVLVWNVIILHIIVFWLDLWLKPALNRYFLNE